MRNIKLFINIAVLFIIILGTQNTYGQNMKSITELTADELEAVNVVCADLLRRHIIDVLPEGRYIGPRLVQSRFYALPTTEKTKDGIFTDLSEHIKLDKPINLVGVELPLTDTMLDRVNSFKENIKSVTRLMGSRYQGRRYELDKIVIWILPSGIGTTQLKLTIVPLQIIIR